MPAPAAALHRAIDVLYSEHHAWVHGWLRRRLGCTHQAADLAHDTFLRAMLAPALTELREPRAWLTTVAHGLLVNHLRRRDLERAYLEALAAQPERLAQSPEERAMVLEALHALDTLLDGLSAKARAAFLLSQLEGMAYADIATRLGVSVSMVKKYMLQAMTHCMGVQRP